MDAGAAALAGPRARSAPARLRAAAADARGAVRGGAAVDLALPAGAHVTRRLRAVDLMAMGLRASLLQATWNYERQQGVGWAWALEPALKRIEPDPARRAARLAEHTAFFNTQPT